MDLRVSADMPIPAGALDPAIYPLLAEQISDGILLHQQDQVVYANPALGELVGKPAAAIIGSSADDLVHPDSPDGVGAISDALVSGTEAPLQAAERALLLAHADGSAIPVDVMVAPTVYRERPAVLILVRHNSGRLQLERRLDELTAEYEMIVHRSHDALALLEIGEDGSPRFRRVNAMVEQLTGIEAAEVTGRTVDQVFGSQLAVMDAPLRKCLETATPVSFELSLPKAKGRAVKTWHCTLVPIVSDGRVGHIVTSAHDITERKQMEEEIRQLSFNDNLLGLYNRRYFEQELRRLEGGREYPVSIICGDIDGLKLINDTMGHREGDRLLKAFARLLRTVFRKSDVVARVGGDEFAVALTKTPLAVAEERCRRLEKLVDNYNRRHPRLPLSVSFGMAVALSREQTLEQVFTQADKQMYQDKVHRTAAAAHSIVRALVSALAQRNHAQDGHISGVTELARRLGKAVGMSKRQMSNLLLLAEMHDLGKVGVSGKILDKRGRLTRTEREQIQQHAMIGYRIARSSPELSQIADLILHHHEWYNGEGYPMGLAGEEIPLACRIISIVDAYEAMTNNRPYRAAMSHERALQELRFFSGLQFDPALTEKFIEVIGDGSDYQRAGLLARTTTPDASSDSSPPS